MKNINRIKPEGLKNRFHLWFRQGLSTCVLNERSIYAIGGHDGWNYLNSVEVLNLDNIERGWTIAKSMKTTRSNSACAVIADGSVRRHIWDLFLLCPLPVFYAPSRYIARAIR